MTESRYKSIFEHTAVALWEEDIGELRATLADLRRKGVSDVGKYVDEHPEFVAQAARMIIVVDANPAAVRLMGMTDRGQLLGRLDTRVDLQSQAVAAAIKDDVVSIAEGREYHERESEVATASGRRASLITTSYVPVEADAYPHMVVSCVDVSETKRAEAALLAAKEYAENLIHTANVMVVGLDLSGEITVFNKAAEEVTGYSRSELRGRSWFEVIVPRDRYPEVWEQFGRLGTNGIARNLENPILTKSGQERYIAWQNNEVREHGRIVGTISFGVDITERKALEDKSLRLVALVEASDDAIVGIGADRSITYWSRGAERIYGYSAAEIVGRPTSLLIPPGLEEEARVIRERLGRGEYIEHFETVRLRKDGRLIDVSLTLSAMHDAAGNMVGMASIARDVTGHKAIQAQLQRMQRLESLGALATGIAHQFNNINAIIKGYLDLLLREEGLPHHVRDYLSKMMIAMRRSVDITERIQGLTGSATPSEEAVRLDDLVLSVIPELNEGLQERNIELRHDLSWAATVKADASRLRFVLTGLLANALDSLIGCPRGTVTVRTGKEGKDVYLEVSDTGCGIPAADMPRIFTPFFTTKGEFAPSGSPQAKVKGVGLTLAVSQSIISEYGGKIVVSSAPGAGTVVHATLPGRTEGESA